MLVEKLATEKIVHLNLVFAAYFEVISKFCKITTNRIEKLLKFLVEVM